MRSLMLVVPLLAFSLVVAAAPADAPKRKSGLWETKVSTQAEGAKGRGMPTIHECVDQKTDDLLDNPMPDSDKPACSKIDLRREGGKLIMDSVCKIESSTATSRTVVTGSFDSAFRGETKSTYSPPVNGMREATGVIEGKWLGPCKPGQKPGDVILPGVEDAMKGLKK